MNDQHVFSYMDSCFMHKLPQKIDIIRPLKAEDFRDQEDVGTEHARPSQPRPQEHVTPPLLLEDAHRDPSPRVDIDAMDVDMQDSEGEDYVEPQYDDDDKEAPSEPDTDEAASRGDEDQLAAQTDDIDSIDSQRRPGDFRASTSPLQGRVLDYDVDPDHVTSLAEDPPVEPHQEVEHEDDHDDEDVGGDEHEVEDEGVHEEVEDLEKVQGDDPDETREEQADRDTLVGEDTTQDVVETPAADLATTSRPTSPLRGHEGGEDIPLPDAPKTKASKRGKHKDRHSKRHSSRSQEPAITESWVEDKVLGILTTTLPSMLSCTLPTMLSGLIQEAMTLARQSTPQPLPLPAPRVEVGVGASEIGRDITQREVAVQGMEVGHVDGATHMESGPTTEDTPDKEEANVSI